MREKMTLLVRIPETEEFVRYANILRFCSGQSASRRCFSKYTSRVDVKTSRVQVKCAIEKKTGEPSSFHVHLRYFCYALVKHLRESSQRNRNSHSSTNVTHLCKAGQNFVSGYAEVVQLSHKQKYHLSNFYD